jgi:hypothetical protein
MTRDIVIYTLLHTIMIISLLLLGETRVDVYISLSVLVYFISTSILPEIRERADLKAADIILITIFVIIVSLRVLEVLGYNIPGMMR